MKYDIKNLKLNNIIEKHYIFLCIILSFIINIFIECIARPSFYMGFLYIGKHPFYFLYNVILLLLMYAVSLLCKKRIFTITLVSSWWIIAGIVNAYVINYRHTPFVAADFFILKDALNIIPIYMSIFEIVLTILGIVSVIVALIILLIKEKKKNTNFRMVSLLLAITISASLFPIDYINYEKDGQKNTNITDVAYRYGFIHCFLNSVFDNGINKPDSYNRKTVSSIIKKIGNTNEAPELKPNIVAIQLESFIDPYKIPTSKYNMDPIPNFRKLKETYSSGKLEVSVYGGGTANTEFEVLSGMNTKYFGVGEYPYETILQKQAVETVCYNLKELGYTSHAFHNHTGTFYERYLVYKNLGFDTFTPSEYMNNIEYNLLGWEKSNVFTKYIFDALKYTQDKDFIFTVTSQCHGRYPNTSTTDYPIKISGGDYVNQNKIPLEYYVNELYQEDIWLGKIIKEFEEYPEPIMAIIYGDHMPSLHSPDSVMTKDEIYSTEYIIWTNYPSEKIDKDLYTYNLVSEALNRININNGILTKLHQYGVNKTTEKDYISSLKNIQYDMLDGNHYVYDENKTLPYVGTNIQYGIDKILIEDVITDNDTTTIKGKNFTKSSIVFVDGNAVDTKFKNPETLLIKTKSCENYSYINVCQRAVDLTVLGQTEPYFNKSQKKSVE